MASHVNARVAADLDSMDQLVGTFEEWQETKTHYDFRVNGRRYRAGTEIADKPKAKNIEARERGRILEGRHGIRRQAT